MSRIKLTIERAMIEEQRIVAFMNNAEKLSGSVALELFSLKRAYKQHTEDAREVEKELQKKYPFKWSHELPGYEQGDEIKRVFDGSSADEKANDKIKAERAKVDEKDFNERWDNVMKKEKEFEWNGSIKESEIAEMNQHGSLMLLLLEILDKWRENIKKEKKKKTD